MSHPMQPCPAVCMPPFQPGGPWAADTGTEIQIFLPSASKDSKKTPLLFRSEVFVLVEISGIEPLTS